MVVVADLARADQIVRIVSVMGADRVDQMFREGARAIQADLGPERTVYHIGPVQFAFFPRPARRQPHISNC